MQNKYKKYWKKNIRYVLFLIAIWFIVSSAWDFPKEMPPVKAPPMLPPSTSTAISKVIIDLVLIATPLVLLTSLLPHGDVSSIERMGHNFEDIMKRGPSLTNRWLSGQRTPPSILGQPGWIQTQSWCPGPGINVGMLYWDGFDLERSWSP